eukprot:UN29193
MYNMLKPQTVNTAFNYAQLQRKYKVKNQWLLIVGNVLDRSKYRHKKCTYDAVCEKFKALDIPNTWIHEISCHQNIGLDVVKQLMYDNLTSKYYRIKRTSVYGQLTCDKLHYSSFMKPEDRVILTDEDESELLDIPHLQAPEHQPSFSLETKKGMTEAEKNKYINQRSPLLPSRSTSVDIEQLDLTKIPTTSDTQPRSRSASLQIDSYGHSVNTIDFMPTGIAPDSIHTRKKLKRDSSFLVAGSLSKIASIHTLESYAKSPRRPPTPPRSEDNSRNPSPIPELHNEMGSSQNLIIEEVCSNGHVSLSPKTVQGTKFGFSNSSSKIEDNGGEQKR